MPAARARLLLVLGGALTTLALGVVACAEDSPADDVGVPSSDGDAGTDSGRKRTDAGSGTVDDAGAPTLCARTRAYFEGCGFEKQLNCGADYETWCAQNDAVINSEAYRKAEAECLVEDKCDPDVRRDCEYRHYASESPTAAQTALVQAYCETCEPGDVSGCKTRSTTYDPSQGLKAVPDIFVAAWELTDQLVSEIQTKCTGSPSDAGAAACAKTFGTCSADVYFEHLPDCP